MRLHAEEPTETSKQPIRTRYLGHVTDYQPIKDQYFLIRSVPFFLITYRIQDGDFLSFSYSRYVRDIVSGRRRALKLSEVGIVHIPLTQLLSPLFYLDVLTLLK
eukprot:sb/3478096/